MSATLSEDLLKCINGHFNLIITTEFIPELARQIAEFTSYENTGDLDSKINEEWAKFTSLKFTKSIDDKKPIKKIVEKNKITQEMVLTMPANKLLKLQLKDLVVLCTEMNLVTKGTKMQLVKNIITKTGMTDSGSKTNKEIIKEIPPPVYRMKTQKITEILPEQSEIVIEKNLYGNLIHKESNIVFNTDKELAIGYEDTDGTVKNLTVEMHDLCNKYGFKYSIG